MLSLIILIVLGFFIGLQWLTEIILNLFGLKKFSDYPIILSILFYLAWLFFNIAGILVGLSVKGCDAILCDHSLLHKSSSFSHAIIFIFYPFAASLWKFIKENPAGSNVRSVVNFISLLSLIACYALFMGAVFELLLGHASLKIGG